MDGIPLSAKIRGLKVWDYWWALRRRLGLCGEWHYWCPKCYDLWSFGRMACRIEYLECRDCKKIEITGFLDPEGNHVGPSRLAPEAHMNHLRAKIGAAHKGEDG